MKKTKVITTEDILLKLCQSVSTVLTSATQSSVTYSAMVQKITKTTLKPDFGCFVLFDGGFSGLVVINFTSQAALEVYSNYMRHMGMPEEELAIHHNADEVGDVLGELMNQLVGDFTNKSSQRTADQHYPKPTENVIDQQASGSVSRHKLRTTSSPSSDFLYSE